jgi:TPP-dependent pyruvate/acetoin dehydrogenase alpha subunit
LTVETIEQQDSSRYKELGLSTEMLLEMYRKLLLTRLFEEKVGDLFEANRLKANYHLYLGQEAIASGVTSALTAEDLIVSNYRGHGHALARGVPAKFLMAELFGKSTGTCKGIGGSMHSPKYPEVNLIYATAIVGSGIPIAAGLALAQKLKNKKSVVVVFFGEGAVNTGAFHEGLNMAAIWRVPLILVCENNQYAISTRVESATSGVDIAHKAESYGIPGVVVEGNDAVSVYLATQRAVERARRGDGPSLLECRTFRIKPHSARERESGRPQDLIEGWKRKDPVDRMRKSLVSGGFTDEEELARIAQEVVQSIDDSITFAEESSSLTLRDLSNLV